MRKFESYLLAIVFGFTMTAPVAAQNEGTPLWADIRSGMSVDQVLAALPGSSLHEDGKTIVGTTTTILGGSFDVFVTTNGIRTQRVELQGNAVSSNDLRAALSSKYGDPLSPNRCSSISVLRTCQQEWQMQGSGKVTLIAMTSNRGAVTTIRYEALDTSGL